MAEQLPTAERPLEPQRRAIIVGASSGLGAALAQRLAGEGYHLALIARRAEELAGSAEKARQVAANGAAVLAYPHDVTHYDEVPALFQKVTAELGGLDLIVYAAAVQPSMTADEYDFAKDQAMVNVNLLGAMAWLGPAAARFSRAGRGQIVGISSVAGDRGRRLNPAYNSSKAGLDTYLEALRNRVTQHGVTVTTIKPGFMDTRLLANAAKTMWVISPEKAAEAIARAIRARKQVVYLPGRWRWVMMGIRHTPSFIFRRLNI